MCNMMFLHTRERAHENGAKRMQINSLSCPADPADVFIAVYYILFHVFLYCMQIVWLDTMRENVHYIFCTNAFA